MQDILQAATHGPTLPLTILLAVVLAYWLLVMIGALDIDALDFDFDLDAEADVATFLSVGFVPLRWLNLGRVPLMLWMSFFALTAWVLSMLLNQPIPEGWMGWTLALSRDIGVAALAAKLFTQPLRGRFDPVQPHRAETLIGRICTITIETNDKHGQARYETEGVPLILHVRADGELESGATAEIIDHRPDGNIFIVRRAAAEQPVPPSA